MADGRRTPLAEPATLDDILSLGEQYYDGETEPPTETTDDDGEEEGGGLTGHPAQETPAPTPSDTPAAEPTEPPTTPEPSPSSPPATPEPTPPATPAEAEAMRRQLEAERRMHQATDEAAQLRTRQDQLETQIADLKRQATSGPATAAGEERRTAARQKLHAAMRELGKVNQEAADYYEQLGNTWADGLDPVMRVVAQEVFEQLGGATLPQSVLDDLVTRVTTEVLTRVDAHQNERRDADRVRQLTAEAGFDIDGADKEDYWGLVVPSLDRSMPADATLDTRIQKSIQVMRTLRGLPDVTEPPARTEVSPTTTNGNAGRTIPIRQPMGRSGIGQGGTPASSNAPMTPEIRSLDDALQATHGRRRG
jgi:hypothetical protein